MNTKFKNMNMLEKYIGLVPDIVLKDVDNRISVWFSMGGEIEDNYIKQQYKYLERYIEFENKIEKDILCINGFVDGVTEGKIYKAIGIFSKEDGEFYSLYDDYGICGLFRKERFIIITNTLIESFKKYLNNK